MGTLNNLCALNIISLMYLWSYAIWSITNNSNCSILLLLAKMGLMTNQLDKLNIL